MKPLAAAVVAISVATSAHAQTVYPGPHDSPASPQTGRQQPPPPSPPPLPWSFPTPAPWTMPQGPQGQNPAPSQNPVPAAPRERMTTPAFDCDNLQPQSNGDHGTVQMIPAGGPFMGPWEGKEINLCITPAIPCLLFRTPTGQRLFVRMMGPAQVLDSGPKIDAAQLNDFRDVGYKLALKCKDAIQKKNK